MTLEDKSDKQGKDPSSERLNNLSEERRKLLDAMMKKDGSEQENASSGQGSGQEGSQQNPGFGQNPFQNQSAGSGGGPQNPWTNMGQNPFQNMGQNPFQNMGPNPFQNQFGGGPQQIPWINMFQNMFNMFNMLQNMRQNLFQNMGQNPFQNMGPNPFQNMGPNPFQNMGQNPFQNMGQNPFQNMGQNPFQNMGPNPFQNMGQNPFQNMGFPGQNVSQDKEGPPPGSPPLSPLVTMKASGSKPPFFCVHAILGSAFPYHNLVLHMEKDQPFYGLQSPAVDGKQAPLDKIEDMAALYIKSIRSVQSRGPYYLGGYSFGGWVAFEMARQLGNEGEKVNLLAIFGTSAPPSATNPVLFERMVYFQQYMDDFRKFVLNSAMSDEYRTGMWSQAGMQSPFVSPLFKIYEANIRSQMMYSPQHYPVKMDLFLTRELQEASMSDPSMGWRMLCPEVETHLVSGNHLNTFHEPHVRDLAEKLTSCLKKAREKR